MLADLEKFLIAWDEERPSIAAVVEAMRDRELLDQLMNFYEQIDEYILENAEVDDDTEDWE